MPPPKMKGATKILNQTRPLKNLKTDPDFSEKFSYFLVVGLVVFVFPEGNDPPPNVFTKSATKILNEMRREKIRKMELVWPEKFGKTGTSF